MIKKEILPFSLVEVSCSRCNLLGTPIQEEVNQPHHHHRPASPKRIVETPKQTKTHTKREKKMNKY
jgi:hypothetical protein